MDANPVAIVKNNLSIGKIAGFLFLSLVVFAVFDLAGITSWILYPVTTAKNKFGKSGN